MADQQAGWYPDPSGNAEQLRYWDGVQWTNDITANPYFTAPEEPQPATAAPDTSWESVAPTEAQPQSQLEADAGLEPQPVEPQPVEPQPAEFAPEQAFEPIAVQPIEVQPIEVQPVDALPEQPFAAQPISVQTEQPYQPTQVMPQAQPVLPVQPVQPVLPVQPAQPEQQYQPPYNAAPQGQYTPPQGYVSAVPLETGKKGKALGITALVLGIVAVIVAFVPLVGILSIPIAAVGLILGIVSAIMARGKRGPIGFGIAGLVCSAVALVVCTVALVVTAVFFTAVATQNLTTPSTGLSSATSSGSAASSGQQGTSGNSSGSASSGSASSASGSASSGPAQTLSGDVVGVVGKEYKTKWFSFTVDSLEVTTSYGSYTAAAGNTLVVARVTEKNTSGKDQPFGTFDWLVDDSSLTQYIYPLDPIDGNSKMMPSKFTLADKESASYDVVIEYSLSLAAPNFMYIEINEQSDISSTFAIPLK